MSENEQDGYLTLGWIINKSEDGLFLVVADEAKQDEIAMMYRSRDGMKKRKGCMRKGAGLPE